jgi:hypothetical protein
MIAPTLDVFILTVIFNREIFNHYSSKQLFSFQYVNIFYKLTITATIFFIRNCALHFIEFFYLVELILK